MVCIILFLDIFQVLGEVGERSNPADCKSAASCFEGSNPSLSTKLMWLCFFQGHGYGWKQPMRVWFNGRTSAFQADDAGSIPATRSIAWLWVGRNLRAHIAQVVEHFLGKEEVIGSSPIMSSRVTRLQL